MRDLENTVTLETEEMENTAADKAVNTDETTVIYTAPAEEAQAAEPEQTEEKEAEPEKVTATEDAVEEEIEEEQVKEDPRFEKRAQALINDSHYLRYVAEMRKADSDLAMAKAESAELVRQMDRFKKHYTEYEKYIRKLIRENQAVTTKNLKRLYGLSLDIKNNSESLSSRIDGEIARLTEELAKTIDTDVKTSCDQELAKVEEATQILHDYSEKVKQQYIRFQTMDKIKFGLFIISSISSPILLILWILSYFHII